MRPFESNPECDKCGSHDMKLRHSNFGESWEGRLVVACMICGYEWEMETKDMKRKSEEEEEGEIIEEKEDIKKGG